MSSRTPGITRRPKPLLKHDKVRVGGRVHAVVMLRPWQIIRSFVLCIFIYDGIGNIRYQPTAEKVSSHQAHLRKPF